MLGIFGLFMCWIGFAGIRTLRSEGWNDPRHAFTIPTFCSLAHGFLYTLAFKGEGD